MFFFILRFDPFLALVIGEESRDMGVSHHNPCGLPNTDPKPRVISTYMSASLSICIIIKFKLYLYLCRCKILKTLDPILLNMIRLTSRRLEAGGNDALRR